MNRELENSIKRPFQTATVLEMAALFDQKTVEAREADPEIGMYGLLKAITTSIPRKASQKAQERAVQAILEGDTEEKQNGQKAILLLNAKTLITVADYYLISGAVSMEECDDVMMSTITALLEKPPLLKSEQTPISLQVYTLAYREMANYVAERDNIPPSQALERIQWGYSPPTADTGSVLTALSQQREDGRNPFETAVRQMLKEDVNNVLYVLPRHTRLVLGLHFGFDGGCGRTLKEIGREFGVTRQNIHQIKARALLRLQYPSRLRGLSSYL